VLRHTLQHGFKRQFSAAAPGLLQGYAALFLPQNGSSSRYEETIVGGDYPLVIFTALH